MRSEKLKILDKEFAKTIEDLEYQHEILLKDLEAVRLEARQKFQHWQAAWIEEVSYWAKDRLKTFLLKEFGSGLKYSKTSDHAQPHDGSKNVGIVSDHVDEGPIAASYRGLISRNNGHSKAESACENQGHIVSMLSYSKEHDSNRATDGAYKDDGQNNSSYSCRDDIVSSVLPSSEGKICDGKTLNASCEHHIFCNDTHRNDSWSHGLITLIQLNSMKKEILSICFGYQMLCCALGGKVRRSHIGWDIGMRSTTLTSSSPLSPTSIMLPSKLSII
ncbi:uncharacterized protein LOC129316814 [Prosopis cineraria]|uniref:uncharacterized protein LOC129316814 n=1 Tax=Prosopis cineraria TaxID=364024 RepID=UPI00240EFFF7|nr:uncharacterized protein LOC129316814 [Prosopis cineraria]